MERYKDFRRSLSLGDRHAAQTIASEIRTSTPDSPFSNLCRLELARMDWNLPEALAAADELMAGRGKNLANASKATELAAMAGEIELARRWADWMLENGTRAKGAAFTVMVDAVVRAYGISEGNDRLAIANPESDRLLSSSIDGRHRHRFLFVSGLPRSGTSALGRLLNLSSDIALFSELWPIGTAYTRDHFQLSTVSQQCEKAGHFELNNRLSKTLNEVGLVGDKRPKMHIRLPATLGRLAGAEVVVWHVVRDLSEVCLSYQARAENAADTSWSFDRDYRVAVSDHNVMANYLASAPQLLPDHQLRVIPYRKLFSDEEFVTEELRRLGLRDLEETLPKLPDFMALSKGVLDKKRVADARVREHIDRYLDVDAQQGMIAQYPQLADECSG